MGLLAQVNQQTDIREKKLGAYLLLLIYLNPDYSDQKPPPPRCFKSLLIFSLTEQGNMLTVKMFTFPVNHV